MLYLIIPALICGLDLWIKGQIEEKDNILFPKEICKGQILLRKSHNTGAMLNFMEKKPGWVAGGSLGILIGLLAGYVWILPKKGLGLLKTGMAFLIGGACSNIYDRLVRHYVVDYFSFHVKWKKLRNIVFNIGDIFIFLGSFLVILWNMRRKS